MGPLETNFRLLNTNVVVHVTNICLNGSYPYIFSRSFSGSYSFFETARYVLNLCYNHAHLFKVNISMCFVFCLELYHGIYTVAFGHSMAIYDCCITELNVLSFPWSLFSFSAFETRRSIHEVSET